MKPVVKWAGGKTQILDEIKNNMPQNFNNYFEPFVGGGAVFLNLNLDNTWINDLNWEIINVYKRIKVAPKKVIKIIHEFIKEYNKNPEQYYYYLRNLDRDKVLFASLNNNFKAARTIFLNKTCFNGLFRVNSKNEFNVPWNGKLKAPQIIEEENFLSIHKYLKKVNITNNDFKKLLKEVQPNDFVYIDPPYDKLKNDTFTSYMPNDFGKNEQQELKEFCDELNKRNVKFLVSNHNTEFIREIYKDYNINIIMAKRNINSKGNSRQPIEEVLIKNY